MNRDLKYQLEKSQKPKEEKEFEIILKRIIWSSLVALLISSFTKSLIPIVSVLGFWIVIVLLAGLDGINESLNEICEKIGKK